uniref:FTH domain-containing protein n=2 Tax=Caenorhabditis tropicalis TaxID=1561998 RepID=A0A1I7TVN3_9PELO
MGSLCADFQINRDADRVAPSVLSLFRNNHFTSMHLDMSLEASISDQIFSEVIKYRSSRSFVLSKEAGLILNLTSFSSYPVSQNVNLQLYDIRSLTINLIEFRYNSEYIIETEEGPRQDIIGILKTLLNEKSRQNLRELRFEGYGRFERNWVEKVGEMLPNLQIFDLCSSLNQIHGLKNLQALILKELVFQSAEGFQRLFELPSLQVLDVSETKGFFRNLSLCEGTFQNLRFIECWWSDITETQLRDLVRRHSSLKVLAVLEILGQRTIGGVKEEEFLKLMMKVTHKYPILGGEKNKVAKCLIPYFKCIFPNQSIINIIKTLDPKAPLFSERKWAAKTVLRFFPEPVRS